MTLAGAGASLAFSAIFAFAMLELFGPLGASQKFLLGVFALGLFVLTLFAEPEDYSEGNT